MNIPESTVYRIADRLINANNTPEVPDYRPGHLLSHGPKSVIRCLIREAAQDHKDATTHTFALELTDAQAWNLAQFLKRLSYDTVTRHAASDDNPDEMRSAIHALRQSLKDGGYAPR